MIRILNKPLIVFLVLSAGLQCHNALADTDIQLVGLFGQKAVLVIDGKRQILNSGSNSPEGVKLVRIEADAVVLDVHGRQERYVLGQQAIGTSYTRPAKIIEQVYKDYSGMYRTVGTINNYPVSFLVDTGATAVAINAFEAKRLGIDFKSRGTPIRVNTASGMAKAYAVKLKSITVGKIKFNNVDAVIIEGSHPTEVLLGMSFLSKLNIQHQGELMVLETKF